MYSVLAISALLAISVILSPLSKWFMHIDNAVSETNLRLTQQAIIQDSWNHVMAEDYQKTNKRIAEKGLSYEENYDDDWTIHYSFSEEGSFHDANCKIPAVAGGKKCRRVTISVYGREGSGNDAQPYSTETIRISSQGNYYVKNKSIDDNKVISAYVDEDGFIMGDINGEKAYFKSQFSKTVPIPDYSRQQMITMIHQPYGWIRGVVARTLVGNSHNYLYDGTGPDETLPFSPSGTFSWVVPENGYVLCEATDNRNIYSEFSVAVYRNGKDVLIYSMTHNTTGGIPVERYSYVSLTPVARGDILYWGRHNKQNGASVAQCYSIYYFPFMTVDEETDAAP